MDYEIVDDTPAEILLTEDQILRMKKDDLLVKVQQAERAAIDRIVPAGKQLFFSIRENEIWTARIAAAHLAAEEQAKDGGVLKSVATAIGLRKPRAVATEDRAFLEDQSFLDDQADRRSKIKAIQYDSAKAQHDIEDLSADTIDAWQAPATLIGE